MSARLGQVCLEYEDDGRSISSETRALIEEEVKALVQGAYARAQGILRGYEHELHALAKVCVLCGAGGGRGVPREGVFVRLRGQASAHTPTLHCALSLAEQKAHP